MACSWKRRTDASRCRASRLLFSEPGTVAPLNAAVGERFGLGVITLRYVPTGRSRADDSVDAVFLMETRDRLDASVSGGRWVGRGEISGIEFERTAGPHVESFMRAVSSDGQVHPLRAEWAKAGCTIPYMGFNLIPLSVIPEIRITDKGLVLVPQMELAPLFE